MNRSSNRFMAQKGRNAIILTNGLLHTLDAKTAHGLIRGSERFRIVGVVDAAENAGKDAGMVMDGIHKGIPVYETLEDSLAENEGIHWLVIGVATTGGKLPANMLEILRRAVGMGLSIVNGLHELLSDQPDIAAMAIENGAELIDIRKPKSKDELHFWTGEIFNVKAPIVAILGMDCAMGKRTTARLLREACEDHGIRSEMIYTGQTGWMQGGKYGFIFDSTLNDFVSGELEHAIVQCWKEIQPDIIFLEGQSGLRNPSGPCGIELMISGNAKHAVLMFAPRRKYYDHDPRWGEIPDVQSEMKIIEMLGTKVIALGLHTEGCSEEEYLRLQKEYQERLNIPVLLVLQQGVDSVIPQLRTLLA